MRKLEDLKKGEQVTLGITPGYKLVNNIGGVLFLENEEGERRVTYDEARRYGLKVTNRIGTTLSTEVVA